MKELLQLANCQIAFLGVEKNSIVAIGEYGQIKNKEDKRLFREGLIAMLDELEPEVVIVYGKMSKKIFDGLLHKTKFVFYEDTCNRSKRPARQ